MHEPGLHPITITNALIKVIDNGVLPLAEALDSVPAEFIKYFLIVATFLVGNYVMLKKSGASSGKAGDPVHLKSPIETKKSPIFADKQETTEAINKLNSRLELLEVRISNNYNDIVLAGHQRTERLTEAMHVVKDEIVEKIDQSLKEAYSRINEQDTRLSRLEGQLSIAKRPRD
jgi:hypothetical protein